MNRESLIKPQLYKVIIDFIEYYIFQVDFYKSSLPITLNNSIWYYLWVSQIVPEVELGDISGIKVLSFKSSDVIIEDNIQKFTNLFHNIINFTLEQVIYEGIREFTKYFSGVTEDTNIQIYLECKKSISCHTCKARFQELSGEFCCENECVLIN